MSEKKTNKKAGRGPAHYAAQFHRTTANKARRAARRLRLERDPKRQAKSLDRAMRRGLRWATKYVANLTRRIRNLDNAKPGHSALRAQYEARIQELQAQFNLVAA